MHPADALKLMSCPDCGPEKVDGGWGSNGAVYFCRNCGSILKEAL